MNFVFKQSSPEEDKDSTENSTEDEGSTEKEEVSTEEEEDWGAPMIVIIKPKTSTRRQLCTDNWPGKFKFQLSFDKEKLSASHERIAILNKSLEKLFIVPNTTVTLEFKVDKSILETTEYFFIRTVPYFRCPSVSSLPVNVCSTHSVTIFGNPMRDHHQHLVLAADQGSKYTTDNESRRHNVLIPVTPVSREGSVQLYLSIKFSDKSSCTNGIGNNPIGALFTLETATEVHGRAKVRVRLDFKPEKSCTFECNHAKNKK